MRICARRRRAAERPRAACSSARSRLELGRELRVVLRPAQEERPDPLPAPLAEPRPPAADRRCEREKRWGGGAGSQSEERTREEERRRRGGGPGCGAPEGVAFVPRGRAREDPNVQQGPFLPRRGPPLHRPSAPARSARPLAPPGRVGPGVCPKERVPVQTARVHPPLRRPPCRNTRQAPICGGSEAACERRLPAASAGARTPSRIGPLREPRDLRAPGRTRGDERPGRPAEPARAAAAQGAACDARGT